MRTGDDDDDDDDNDDDVVETYYSTVTSIQIFNKRGTQRSAHLFQFY